MRESEPRYTVVDGLRFRITGGGLLYAPLASCYRKKHPCDDCHACGWCSESRCRHCRGSSRDDRDPDRISG